MQPDTTEASQINTDSGDFLREDFVMFCHRRDTTGKLLIGFRKSYGFRAFCCAGLHPVIKEESARVSETLRESLTVHPSARTMQMKAHAKDAKNAKVFLRVLRALCVRRSLVGSPISR